MKRNVSVVCLIVATRSSGPPASQPVSCLTRLSADLCHLVAGAYTVQLLFVSASVMCEFTQDSWKMYRCTVEERVFIVRTYWKTESINMARRVRSCLDSNGRHFQHML